MAKLNRLHVVLLAMAVILSGSLAAQANDTFFQDTYGKSINGVRCATPVPSLDRTEETAREIGAWLEAGGFAVDKAGEVIIPVAVHVVAHTDGSLPLDPML